MAINKVVYGTKVLVDLTSDTVDAAHLAKGRTAHDAGGNIIVGTLEQQASGNLLSGVTPRLLNGATQSGKEYVIPDGVAKDTECIEYQLDIPKLTSDVNYCLFAYGKTKESRNSLIAKLYFEVYGRVSFRSFTLPFATLGDAKAGSFKMTRESTLTKLVFESGGGSSVNISNITLITLDV